MKRYLNRLKTAALSLGFLMIWSSCTKYENPPAIYEEYEQEGDMQVKRKVLFISIDGAVGKEIKEIMPTNIAEMLKTSKYTFDAIANDNTKDAASWMSMMSGVTYDMHQIEDDSYIPKPNENNPHQNAAGYPSILYRMATISPGIRKMAVVRDKALTTKLLISADEGYDEQSDEEVKNQMLSLLDKKNPDFAIVQFKDVLDAGVKSKFSASSTVYTDAVKKVDGYIGEILSAVKARKNYETEEWLVIITSNHGGIDQSYGGSSFQERNTFAIFQHPNFEGLELKSELMKSMRFFGFYDSGQTSYAYYGPDAFRGRNSPVLAEESIYDLGKTGELTVEAKIKMNPTNGTYDYASNTPFLGKNQARTGQTPGWTFYRAGNNVTFFVADGATSMETSMGPVSSTGEWAHLTAVISKVNGVSTAVLYVNGLKTGQMTNTNLDLKKVVTATGLTFGYYPYIFSGLPNDLQLCDVHIYNKAMDEESIKKNANRIGIPDAELSNPNLIGYWPMDELVNNKFVNKISGNPDITAQGTSRLVLTGNNLPYVPENSILIQPQDYFTQIFYWLEIQPQKEWGLQGQVFLNKYEIEFLKP